MFPRARASGRVLRERREARQCGGSAGAANSEITRWPRMPADSARPITTGAITVPSRPMLFAQPIPVAHGVVVEASQHHVDAAVGAEAEEPRRAEQRHQQALAPRVQCPGPPRGQQGCRGGQRADEDGSRRSGRSGGRPRAPPARRRTRTPSPTGLRQPRLEAGLDQHDRQPRIERSS